MTAIQAVFFWGVNRWGVNRLTLQPGRGSMQNPLITVKEHAMNSIMTRLLRGAFPLAVLFLAACGGGWHGGWGGGATPTTPTSSATYSVGGTLTGLTAGNNITLTDNGADTLPLTTNGPFTFATRLANAAVYNVAIGGTPQPTNQPCTLTYGAGTINATNVTNLNVFCGLAGGHATFTATGSLAAAREHHTATLLPNGLVLASAGQGTAGALASAELFNPASGTWTATGSLATPRYNHTATLLPNGLVLVSGGNNSSIGYLASAELYDPTSGNWLTTGSLLTLREYHTATRLSDGKVLVSGGYDGSYLASAEVYW